VRVGLGCLGGTPVQLADLLQDVLREFRLLAENKLITVKADFAPDLPLIDGDIDLLERMISNLLDNAIRHTPDGGTIDVKLAVDAQWIRRYKTSSPAGFGSLAMCGIAGMVDWRAATTADALRTIGGAMIETVRHRGPDAGAVWVEAESGVVLGQRRLAIIDLSPGGAQPMHSADRRHVITFNGEIYNYRDIRRELAAAGCSMRSDSDTEVLLEACALWGVEAAIERTIGMFAFALWDRKTRTLVLARDRLGIKPLYYAVSPDRVLFASQLKAFRAVPGWKPTIDDDAVVGYLRHAYIAQPRTIYREAEKLAPGWSCALDEQRLGPFAGAKRDYGHSPEKGYTGFRCQAQL